MNGCFMKLHFPEELSTIYCLAKQSKLRSIRTFSFFSSFTLNPSSNQSLDQDSVEMKNIGEE